VQEFFKHEATSLDDILVLSGVGASEEGFRELFIPGQPVSGKEVDATGAGRVCGPFAGACEDAGKATPNSREKSSELHQRCSSRTDNLPRQIFHFAEA